MDNWAGFWLLVLAIVALLEGWVIVLLSWNVRDERQARQTWKARYFHEREQQ